MRRSLVAHLRRQLLHGVALVLPLLITAWLLELLFRLIDERIGPHVGALLERMGVPGLDHGIGRFAVPLVGALLTLLFVYLLGLFAGNMVGKRIVSMIERAILRVPLVKGIYGSARQLLDAFTTTGSRAFSKVVLLEYPRPGTWALGFVTATDPHHIPTGAAEPIVTVPVFLPTTPNPTSGWMVFVPRSDLMELDMTIDEAMKLVVSGGIVGPADLGRRLRRRADGG